MKVEAVVLAGARNDGKLKEASACEFEALIPVGNRPMVEYVTDALEAADSVKRTVVVGPHELAAAYEGTPTIDWVEFGSSMVENIQIGIERLDPEGHVLIVTSDIPLITAEAIDDFVARCRETNADIYYPIVRQEVNEKAFPGVKRTYVRLKDGVYTGGNLALLEPEIVPACRDMIERAVSMRKKPLKLSRMLGFKFIFKLLFNRLTLAEIEERVHRILGFRGVGVESPFPEVGIDIDKPEDLELVERALKQLT